MSQNQKYEQKLLKKVIITNGLIKHMQKPEAARKANSNVFPNKLTSNKNLHSPIDRIGIQKSCPYYQKLGKL